MYEEARVIYEKLTIFKFIEENMSEAEVNLKKSEIADKFENMATNVLKENKGVPENNPHAEDIIKPGMDTIKDMMSEMTPDTLAQIFGEFVAKSDVMKNDAEIIGNAASEPIVPAKEEKPVQSTPLETNSVPTPAPVKTPTPQGVDKKPEPIVPVSGKHIAPLAIGLNDKLAFINHLFNKDTEAYTKAITELNSIGTEERSKSFVYNLVKPEYNQWEGKEEYEARLFALIEARFN